MTDNKWNTKYKQLNERSRWYSSQLWYIPFAYIAIMGVGWTKIMEFDYPFKSIGFILLGIFSISVFVHVSSIKYYERKAVKSMQEMEDTIISHGWSSWYLSFAFYIKSMILIASYFFIIYGFYILIEMGQGECDIAKTIVLVTIFLGMSIFYSFIIWKDYTRNKKLDVDK